MRANERQRVSDSQALRGPERTVGLIAAPRRAHWRVMLEPDPIITCIDCGGRAHLLTEPRVDEEDSAGQLWQPGDIVAYRCEDCLDRWDIVLADDDETGTD